MIITDKIIFLHFPKSGGTFISKAIEHLYLNNILVKYSQLNPVIRFFKSKVYFEDFRENDAFDNVLNNRNNHNGYSQIPIQHKGKPVFTSIRNPFDFYVSYYETKKWATAITLSDPEILTKFPSFPELSFEEFLEFIDFYYINKVYSKITGLEKKCGLGLYTMLFIFLYCVNPLKVFSLIVQEKDADLIEKIITENIAKDIKFICFNDLRNNLYNYLVKFYPENSILFIFNMKGENVGKSRKFKEWELYYNDQTLKKICDLDCVSINFYKKLCG
jgi:hypothetical protein